MKHEDPRRDQYNDCYGRERRMYLHLQQRKDGKTDHHDIPCEATVRKVMVQIGLIHEASQKAKRDNHHGSACSRKSDDLLSDVIFTDRPLKSRD